MTFWLIEDIWSVCWRELKRFSRQKARIITTMVQSIIWLVFMSNIFARVTSLPGFPASSYLEYMTPGIVVMSTMFGGVFGGLSIVWDRRFGFLNKMLAAPINRSSIPIGKMLATAVISGFQSSVILSVALFMGVRFVT
ncbi:MAG: ABC transporter permease, partial [Candidatus Bathyarchaeia archaeon]